MVKPQQYEVKIIRKEKLTHAVYLFTFQVNTGEIAFLPGQYATFVIDSKIRRQYSLCSAPKGLTTFELVIDVAPMGLGSQFFLNKNVGDIATCIAPLGNFVMQNNSRKKVFIATGTGVAPFRSMMVKNADTSDMALYWGLRHEEDMYWKDEFENLTRTHPNISFHLTLSKPSEKWRGLRGHVTDHVTSDANNEYYLCGNRMMVCEMEEKLKIDGIPKDQVYKEMFF